MIIALAILLAIASATSILLYIELQKIKKRVTWVEQSEGIIEEMIAIHEDLMRYSKASIEIRRLDPAGFLYREPVR